MTSAVPTVAVNPLYFDILGRDGPLPAWLGIVIGALLAIGGLGAFFGAGKRPGFATADATVVEVERPGRRPTVVEFTPAGSGPVRVKQRDRLELGQIVRVQYSTADPRNARVDDRTSTQRRGYTTKIAAFVVLVIGVLLIISGTGAG